MKKNLAAKSPSNITEIKGRLQKAAQNRLSSAKAEKPAGKSGGFGNLPQKQ